MHGHVKKERFFRNINVMHITFHCIVKCTRCRFELTLPQQTLIKKIIRVHSLAEYAE